MTRTYTEAETIAAIDDLTGERLVTFVRARIVQPVHAEGGPRYREADLARLQLLCDLAESYDLQDEPMSLVMSLIDQLNTMRGDMRALIEAVAAEPDEVRTRIHTVIRQRRG
ncbi:hypothetical protein MLD63_01340 (plasmid) [Paracoccus sp. TK19116]|uniref:Chaperone modulatory protein CbpM n=1 Tax=Paracoccus albicereus TaxID=2922394 RepID=A0ABT1MNR0_9RHOB|nr:hypothetical protein [Paracoccus albicereus]MCQ0969078.1 hypothetical protein [Paracoccus albicereus]